MKSFRKIISRLIPVKNNEQTPDVSYPEAPFAHSCSKAKRTFFNVSHHHRRLRGSNSKTNRYALPHRNITHVTSGFQRSAESTDVTLRPSNSSPQPHEASGARRAPIIGNVQNSRSPRLPFEESVITYTRRTPGSEDATSVVTEIGYPVVGPATPRIGQNLTSTLFHQEVIVFSQDVSTNTSQTEPLNVNIPLIRTFSDGPPSAEEGIAVNAEEDAARMSTESQTTHVDAVAVLRLPEIPWLSRAQSVTPEEQERQGTSHGTSEQPSQEDDPTATQIPPTIGREFSPFRPVPKAAEASQPSNQVSSSKRAQTGRPPKNVCLPSQVKKNRPNTDNSNGPSHRKTLLNSDDGVDGVDIDCRSSLGFCGKVARANVTSSDSAHRVGPCAGCCCSRGSEIRPDDTLIEIMIHSLHCSGKCRVVSRLEDSPHSNTAKTSESFRNVQSLQKKCRDVLFSHPLTADTQQLALNIMSCVSWSDVPNNVTVTDSRGNAVQNAQIGIISYSSRSPGRPSTPSEKPSNPKIFQRSYPENENCADGSLGEKQLKSLESDLAFPSLVPVFTHSKLEPTIPSSASQLLDYENEAHNVDCTTQSTLRDDFQAENDWLNNDSKSCAPDSIKCNDGNLSNSFDAVCLSNPTFNKPYAENNSKESSEPNFRRKASLEIFGNHSRKKIIRQSDSITSINQTCGIKHGPLLSSIGVSCSFPDQHSLMNFAAPEKDKQKYVVAPTADVPDVFRKTTSTPPTTEIINPDDTIRTMSEVASRKMPLLLVTVPERESRASAEEVSIEIQNHLFVKKHSEVSVASSVYIRDDGIAAVTRHTNSKQSDSSASESPQRGTSAQTTATVKRELGARPKIRGEPLSFRKKMLAINDESSARDRSSGMDDIRNLRARGHRVISEGNRGRVRNQVSSRKNHLGTKDPRFSPGRWTRRTDSRSFGASRRPCSEQRVEELRSIWINPETEQSLPSSNSTIDIAMNLSQTFLLSDRSKSPSLLQGASALRARPRTGAKSPSPVPGGIHGALAEFNISTFECASCKDYLNPPIRQCNDGHCICAKCLRQSDSCPVCHSSVPTESNKVVDNLIRTIRFPCKNGWAGCRETYWIEDYSTHESRCLYRQRTCPFANRSTIHCTWKGVRSGIRCHMKKCHGHSGIVHPFRSLFTVGIFDSKLWSKQSYDVEILFVESEIFELHKVFDCGRSCVWGLLRHILSKDVSQRYVYYIKFQPKNIRGSVTFHAEAIEGAEDLNKALEQGKRFKFYLDSFSSEPLEVFTIHLKVIPKTATMFNNVL